MTDYITCTDWRSEEAIAKCVAVASEGSAV